MDYQELMDGFSQARLEEKVISVVEQADLQARYTVQQTFPGKIRDFQDTQKRLLLFGKELFRLSGMGELPAEYALGKIHYYLRVPSLADIHLQVRDTTIGLNEYYRKLKERLIKEQQEAYYSSLIEQIDAYDYDVIKNLMAEYVRQFGRFLNFPIQDVNTLMMRWKSILMNHAQVLDRIKRDVGVF